MRSNLSAVIFDHSTLLGNFAPTVARELQKLLPWLKKQDILIVVFSTHYKDIQAELRSRGLPPADLFLTRRDVGYNKGSERWVEEAAQRLGIQNHQLVYIGDDERDWQSAVNTATCYLQANWAGTLPARLSALSVDKPREVVKYLTHYLFTPPRWTYSVDSQQYGLYLRSLLPATAALPSSAPGSSFTLQDIFSEERVVHVGKESARDVLMLHTLSSLYVEGLIRPRSLFAVYPSHAPGQISAQLRGYLGPAASFFGTYFKQDLLVRWRVAKDTSKERGDARREQRSPDVSVWDQVNSVHVNPRRRSTINSRNRNVIVFDDFTTTGTSLEWARNLLYSGGADKVVLVTIGKYGITPQGRSHQIHALHPTSELSPYEPVEYGRNSMFRVIRQQMQPDELAGEILRTSFEYLKALRMYPINTL